MIAYNSKSQFTQHWREKEWWEHEFMYSEQEQSAPTYCFGIVGHATVDDPLKCDLEAK